MNVIEILDRLVSFASVAGRSNGEIVDWIRGYLGRHGIEARILPGPEGDRANLFASIGPAVAGGLLLSGHMDVVPAEEEGWDGNPFSLREAGGRLHGRGASDMKGFLACVLAAIPHLASRPLSRPVHLAFSYDEEAGCRGAPHLIAALPGLCPPPAACLVGEPTSLRPVLGHKGKAAIRITVRGRAGHSARPDLGANAIHAMAELLARAVAAAEDLARGRQDAHFEPPYPTLQVGTISGGRAINVIPELCTVEIEARALPGVDPLTLLQPVMDHIPQLEENGFSVGCEIVSAYPGLAIVDRNPLADLLAEINGTTLLPAVSFGTEAGLFQRAGVPAVICGPGDIGRAHKANEYILPEELQGGLEMIRALAARWLG